MLGLPLPVYLIESSPSVPLPNVEQVGAELVCGRPTPRSGSPRPLLLKPCSTVTRRFLVPRLGRGQCGKVPKRGRQWGGGDLGAEWNVSEALVQLHKSIPPIITQPETQVPRWPVLFSRVSPPPPLQAELMTHFALGLQQQHPVGCTNS